MMRLKVATGWLFFMSIVALFSTPAMAISEANAEEDVRANEVIELLNRMSLAVDNLDYSGRLIHVEGNKIATLQVFQRVRDGLRHSRVVPLSDDATDFSSDGRASGFSYFTQINPDAMKYYDFEMNNRGRIAGLPCQNVTVRPKDDLRYLYRYCIIERSGLLLNYEVLDEKRGTVKRIMFTDMEQNPKLDDKIFAGQLGNSAIGLRSAPRSNNTQPDTQQKKETEEAKAKQSFDAAKEVWKFEGLPLGFRLKESLYTALEGTDILAKQYIFTDGVASISVFISPKSLGGTPKGRDVGTMKVLTLERADHSIILMGEVPRRTLQVLSQAISYHP